jgi:hypothetical protein
MEISFQDRSNYFKGMLLLRCKDTSVDESDINQLRRLGKILGFEPQFCEYVIRHYLDNTFVIKEPIKFSNPEITRTFIRDGIKICITEHILHIPKIELLHKVASEHFFPDKWFARELYRYLDLDEDKIDRSFEIDKFFKIKYEFNSKVFESRLKDISGTATLHRNF